jgi:hypothetical protein
MAHTITWKDKGIIWAYTGTLTGPELLESNFKIFGDERFDDLRYQIADLTGVEKFDFNAKHMRKIAHLDMAASQTNPRIKVAIVTTSEIGVELTRVYEKYTSEKSSWDTGIFANLKDAETWLGLDDQ